MTRPLPICRQCRLEQQAGGPQALRLVAYFTFRDIKISVRTNKGKKMPVSSKPMLCSEIRGYSNEAGWALLILSRHGVVASQLSHIIVLRDFLKACVEKETLRLNNINALLGQTNAIEWGALVAILDEVISQNAKSRNDIETAKLKVASLSTAMHYVESQVQGYRAGLQRQYDEHTRKF
ncbi:MAG: hypothetical protein AAB421_01215 [Patescibacteria group bacterium]